MGMRNAWTTVGGVSWHQNEVPDAVQMRTWSTEELVHWEIRSITQYVISSQIRRLGPWLRRDAQGWNELCQRLFGTPGYIESRRASESSTSVQHPVGQDQESHAEWASSTSSVVLLLAWLGVSRRSDEERSKAKGLLLQWLLKFSAAESREAILSAIPSDVAQQVCQYAGAAGSCACWAAIDSLTQNRGATHERLQTLLLECMVRKECGKCLMYLGYLSLELQAVVDETFDPDSFLTDGTKAQDNQVGRQKRRRIDEGVKESTLAAVAAGRAHNSTALLRAMDDRRSGQAHLWDTTFLKEHLARMQLSWNKGGCFGLTPDAARFGNPGQENLICAVWHADTLTGGWAPPQVLDSFLIIAISRTFLKNSVQP